MNFKNKTPDIEKIFNQNWTANNYRLNGVKNAINNQKEANNRVYGVKSKEEIRKEVLERNSVEGQVARLKQQMKAGLPNNKNIFR